MNKSYGIAFIIALIVAGWMASGLFLQPEPEPGAQHSAAKTSESEPPRVRVRHIKAETVTRKIVLNGTTQADRKVEIKAEIDGRIEKILAAKGTTVTQGDILVEIETNDRQANLKKAQELLEQREIEFNAAQKLEEKGFNSKVKLATARADLEAARAAVKKAMLDLKNTKITAPFDGILDTRAVEIGDYVNVGTIIGEVVDLDPIKIISFVSETRIEELELGKPATARLQDGTELNGVISYISSSANDATRTFRVEVSVPNPTYSVVEGLTTRVYLPAAERQAYKITPAVLTLNDDGEVGVKIVDDQNRARFVKIDIVLDLSDAMWIAGLPDQTTLITVGQDYVADGQEVIPVTSDTPERLL